MTDHTSIEKVSSTSWESLLICLVPLSVLPFATVHDGWIILSSIVLLLIPLLQLSHPPSPPSRITFLFSGLTYAALFLASTQVIPSTSHFLPLLSPGLSEHVWTSLSLSGADTRPLALNLPAALRGLCWTGAGLGLVLTISQRGRHLHRGLAWSIVVAGLLTCVLAAAHRLTNADAIYWWSGIPSLQRTPFYGPFVNPNHAGTLLAAGVGVALGLGRRAGTAAAALLAVGVWFTGSRGAMIALLAAAAVFVLRTQGRRGALALGALLLAAALPVLWAGPQQAARWLTLQIVPEDHIQDLTGRRLAIWADSLSLLGDAPLLGVGLGGFADGFRFTKQLPQYAAVDHAHNDLLQAFIEQGVLGGALWLAAAGLVLWSGLQRPDRLGAGWLAAAAALGCASLVDFPFQIGALSILAAVVAGVLLSAPGRSASTVRLTPFLLLGATVAVLSLGGRLLLSTDDALVQSGDDAYAAQSTDAVEHYRRALWLAPMSHQALLRLGRDAWLSGDLDRAAAIYEHAAAGYPTLLWPWVNLARLRARQGDPSGAHLAWRAVLRSNVPDNDAAAPWIQEALSVGSDPVAAALAIAPERGDRRCEIASELSALLDTPGARAAARQLYMGAIDQDFSYRLDYANELIRWQAPEAALEQLAALPEESCRAARLAGKALERLDRPSEAIRRYRQARRSCPASLEDRIDAGIQRVQEQAGDPAALTAAAAELNANPSRDALRRRVVAGLCRTAPLPKEALLGHLEHLILEGRAQLSESLLYSRLIANGGCAEPERAQE